MNHTVLNRFFTQYSIEDLLDKDRSSLYETIIKRYNIDPSDKTNGQIISEIYCILSQRYRNEYFYQNTILNKLLLGVHSIRTTTALTQIPIGKSKADFIMINGKAVVYEIKSELDSFDRLETQLADYYKAFDRVCVVTSQNNYEKIKHLLHDSPVGFYILTSKDTLSKEMRKLPIADTRYLDHSSIFKLLHKKEFESIIHNYYQKLPSCPPVFYHNECFEFFSKIPITKIYQMVLKELKKRNRIVFEGFSRIPYELKSLVYFSNATPKHYRQLNNFLEKKYLIINHDKL